MEKNIMPKNRKRVIQKGAKSVAIRTKHKIGGRKSNRGVQQMSIADLEKIAATCRPRDRFKITRELAGRATLHVSPGDCDTAQA